MDRLGEPESRSLATGPRLEYERRLAERRTAAAVLERRHALTGNSRIAVVLLGLALLWPTLVWKLRTQTLVLLALGLFFNSVILPMQLHATPDAAMPLWFSTHGLALGALLAILLRSEWASRSRSVWLAVSLTITGFSLLWLSRFDWREQLHGTLEGMAWDILFAALVLVALLVGTSRYERFTRPQWLLFIGKISYGLYLLHVLVFATYRRVFRPGDDLRAIVAEFVVCSLVAIGLAAASRLTIEEWFLDLKDKPLFQAKARGTKRVKLGCLPRTIARCALFLRLFAR